MIVLYWRQSDKKNEKNPLKKKLYNKTSTQIINEHFFLSFLGLNNRIITITLTKPFF